MKELTLRNTELKALVDDGDYERLLPFKWHLFTTGTIRRYGKQHTEYEKVGIYIRSIRIRPTIALANEVMQNFSVMYDHMDRNSLNNQKNNLRLATSRQNNFNRSKGNNCASKYKGVSWCSRVNKWNSSCTLDGKSYFIGYFTNEIDAAKAYNEKAKELHKEFANLNTL